jgi:hypothetical protein
VEVLKECEGAVAGEEIHQVAGDGRHSIKDANAWGRSFWCERLEAQKKERKTLRLGKKNNQTTKRRSPRNQLCEYCVSQKAQPTSVSILDCSKVLIISKQNVPCLPDRDWQSTPRRLKIIIQLKHRQT